MTTIWEVLGTYATLAAALSSAGLAALAVAQRTRGRLRWLFVAGMLAFAAESLVSYVLLTAAEGPRERRLWLQAAELLGLAAPVAWAFFVGALIHPAGTRRPASWTTALFVIAGLSVAGATAIAVWPAFDVPDMSAPFYAARLEPVASVAVAVQLLTTVAVVGGLETFLRTASRANVWRSKYLVLGLGGLLLGRFYFLSQVLLFHVVMASYLASEAGMLVLANLAIATSLLRGRLHETELAVSRRIVYQSVGVGVLGLYLFVVGVMGWLLTKLDIPETVFFSSLFVFISALVLAALVLSDDVRWRAKRFISLHFYRSKYDYRERWIDFTKRLGSRLSIDDLVANLLVAATGAVGAAKGAVYLDDGAGSYRLAGERWIPEPLPVLDGGLPLLRRLDREQRPFMLQAADGKASAREVLDFMPAGSVAVPLIWQSHLTGVMLIGPERTQAPYSAEDLQFLATVGEQASGAIVTAQLSEGVARAREFEAFHRLTSFVIHDLKNSISSLSLLTDNAMRHFDDPEFQRDAITTLSRTVGRMTSLLARLSTAPDAGSLRFERVDLAALASEACEAAAGKTASVVRDLAAVAEVEGDAEALLRVFQNLVKNAIESLSGSEGVVTVRTYAESGWAVFCVADTGCGMSEEFVRTSLFAPFRSTKRGGWGIGLYQSKTIVEAHEGRIEVATKEGSGTTFLVKLPLERASG